MFDSSAKPTTTDSSTAPAAAASRIGSAAADLVEFYGLPSLLQHHQQQQQQQHQQQQGSSSSGSSSSNNQPGVIVSTAGRETTGANAGAGGDEIAETAPTPSTPYYQEAISAAAAACWTNYCWPATALFNDFTFMLPTPSVDGGGGGGASSSSAGTPIVQQQAQQQQQQELYLQALGTRLNPIGTTALTPLSSCGGLIGGGGGSGGGGGGVGSSTPTSQSLVASVAAAFMPSAPSAPRPHHPHQHHHFYIDAGISSIAAATAAATAATSSSSTTGMPAKRSQAGRRPKEQQQQHHHLGDGHDEDTQKRMKRRQRNKEAAARCRARRLELMEALQAEVDEQKKQNNQKETIIRNLKRSQEQMTAFLRAHQCRMSADERRQVDQLLDKIVVDGGTSAVSSSSGAAQRPNHLPVAPLTGGLLLPSAVLPPHKFIDPVSTGAATASSGPNTRKRTHAASASRAAGNATNTTVSAGRGTNGLGILPSENDEPMGLAEKKEIVDTNESDPVLGSTVRLGFLRPTEDSILSRPDRLELGGGGGGGGGGAGGGGPSTIPMSTPSNFSYTMNGGAMPSFSNAFGPLGGSEWGAAGGGGAGGLLSQQTGLTPLCANNAVPISSATGITPLGNDLRQL